MLNSTRANWLCGSHLQFSWGAYYPASLPTTLAYWKSNSTRTPGRAGRSKFGIRRGVDRSRASA